LREYGIASHQISSFNDFFERDIENLEDVLIDPVNLCMCLFKKKKSLTVFYCGYSCIRRRQSASFPLRTNQISAPNFNRRR
jgi:hypothetical protein